MSITKNYIMLLIAHRGLWEGPNKDRENHPHQIQQALDLGFNVEIDLRMEDQQLYLGHDKCDYKIDSNFLLNPRLWIHAKDLDSCNYLNNMYMTSARLNYFWHQDDQRVLTSWGYWWTHPQAQLTTWSIAVMPEHVMDPKNLISWATDKPCAGICSDYVGLFKI